MLNSLTWPMVSMLQCFLVADFFSYNFLFVLNVEVLTQRQKSVSVLFSLNCSI